MQLSIGIGNSSKIDGYEAGLEAASTVKEQLGADDPDFVFVFSNIGYEQQDILDAVAKMLGDVPLSGATFEGIIGREFVDESMVSISITALALSKPRLQWAPRSGSCAEILAVS